MNIHEQAPASANRLMDNVLVQRTLLAAGVLASVAALGVAKANAGSTPALTPTETLDGKGFEAYPGDPSAPGSESFVFGDCFDEYGHQSYEVNRMRPSTSDPAHKAVVNVDRTDLGRCDAYVDREISKVVLKTRLAGQTRWKTSRVPLASVTTDQGRTRYNLKPLDYGQTLRKGKSLRAKLQATTVVTNRTFGVPGEPLGSKSTKTQTLGKAYTIRR